MVCLSGKGLGKSLLIQNKGNHGLCQIFTELVLRPIQFTICNVRLLLCLCVCAIADNPLSGRLETSGQRGYC